MTKLVDKYSTYPPGTLGRAQETITASVAYCALMELEPIKQHDVNGEAFLFSALLDSTQDFGAMNDNQIRAIAGLKHWFD